MFVPENERFVVATMLTQGPWDPNSQYGGAPAALLTWAVERVPTLVPMRIARITVDLPAQTVRGPDGAQYAFEIDAFARHCLVDGLDEISYTMTLLPAIEAYEARLAKEHA